MLCKLPKGTASLKLRTGLRRESFLKRKNPTCHESDSSETGRWPGGNASRGATGAAAEGERGGRETGSLGRELYRCLLPRGTVQGAATAHSGAGRRGCGDGRRRGGKVRQGGRPRGLGRAAGILRGVCRSSCGPLGADSAGSHRSAGRRRHVAGHDRTLPIARYLSVEPRRDGPGPCPAGGGGMGPGEEAAQNGGPVDAAGSYNG